MSAALIEAELALSRALMALGRARGTPEEPEAERKVRIARKRLEAARAMPVGKDERMCCGQPMLYMHNRWICAVGLHDD